MAFSSWLASVPLFFLGPVEGPPRDLTLVGDVERGTYLIRMVGCVLCHTDAANGRAFFSGGGRRGRAPAITRAALVEDGCDIPTLVQTLQDRFTPGFDVLGSAMGEVITDSTSHMTEEDLTALAEFLLAE